MGWLEIVTLSIVGVVSIVIIVQCVLALIESIVDK